MARSTRPKAIPAQAELHRLFDYDATTGRLIWRTRPETNPQWNGRFAGHPAGAPTNTGHVQVRLNGQMYLAHRLIWKWLHDEEPLEVDHIDCVGSNNRPNNLRRATRSENVRNTRRAAKKNLPKGVFPYSGGAFYSQIRTDGKVRRLGTFPTVEQAHAAYCRAAEELHGQFARFD